MTTRAAAPEKKGWVDLIINAGQAELLGTGFGGLARAGIMIARSIYERAKEYFLDEEHRLEEAIAAARDRVADLETRLRDVRDAKLDLELDYQDAQRIAGEDDNSKSAGLGAHAIYR